MELLILGIDGGSQNVIDRMDMPFLKSLLKSGRSKVLTEDLHSRGWAEMLTGMHGTATGAYYMHPKLDGTYGFHTSFNTGSLTGIDDVTPLWKLLSDRGKNIGFMNVPTTGPAPQVNGYVVAGGGGGLDKVDGVPPSLCYPKDLPARLAELDYIVDLRLTSSDVRSLPELIDRLDTIVQRRASSFNALARDYAVEVGFACFRASTTLGYLAMHEIEKMPVGGGDPRGLNPTQTLVHRHFRQLDDAIAKVFETNAPRRWLVTSDHGHALYTHTVNADPLLERHGFLKSNVGGKSVKSSIRGLLRRGVPRSLKRKYRSKLPDRVQRSLALPFDPARSEAFGAFYVPGIFVNDDERFGGPVPTDERMAVAQKIVTAVNGDEEAKRYQIRAEIPPPDQREARFGHKLPDVMLRKPDALFFTGRGPFVAPNPNNGPLPRDLGEAVDMHSGQKGRHPLFTVDAASAETFGLPEADDLTAVYHMVDAMTQIEKGDSNE